MSASIFEVDSLSEKDIDYIEQLIERNVILELSTISDFDEQKLFENYFNNQNPPVPIHFKIIVQNEE